MWIAGLRHGQVCGHGQNPSGSDQHLDGNTNNGPDPFSLPNSSSFPMSSLVFGLLLWHRRTSNGNASSWKNSSNQGQQAVPATENQISPVVFVLSLLWTSANSQQPAGRRRAPSLGNTRLHGTAAALYTGEAMISNSSSSFDIRQHLVRVAT